MTIRTMAKILGISPAYLSLLINGKRKWKADLKERYETLVNTFVNSDNRLGEKKWCPGRDSNPHSLIEKRILSPPRLPFRHLGIYHKVIRLCVQNGITRNKIIYRSKDTKKGHPNGCPLVSINNFR